MRVSKNQVTLLSAAVAALFAVGAQAQVVVNNTPVAAPALVGTPASYANELNLGTAGLALGAAFVTDFSLQGTLGFGLQTGDVRYIRLDYSGATLLAATAPASLTFTAPCTATSFIVSGGGAGSTFVIYQVNATANCAASSAFQFPAGAGMTVTTKTPTVTYALFQDSAGAAQQLATSLLRQGAAVPLLTFTNAVVFTMQPVVQEIAAATTNFTKFCANGLLIGTAGCAATATDFGAIVGQVNQFRLLTTVKRQDGAFLAAMTDVATGASLVVTGNFAAAGATLSTMTTNGCGTGATASAYVGTTVTTAATATYPNGTSGATGLLNTIPVSGIEAQYLCYNVPTTNAVAVTPQLYTATMNLTPATGYLTPSIVRDSGQIVRDGVEFQSPWFNFNSPSYTTRFFLTNTGSADAVCSVALMSETGNTLTAGTSTSITVPGTTGSGNANGGVLHVTTASIVASATALNRGAVRFICSAPSASMQGTFVTTATNGAFSNTPMLRPGTN